MERTKREIRTSKLKKFSKKNKLCRIIAMALLFVLTIGYSMIQFFSDNRKRFASIATVWLIFAVSCSFSLPAFIEVSQIDGEEPTETLLTEEDELIRELLAGEEDVLIDDEELLDGYEDEDLNTQDVAVYTADEILNIEVAQTDKATKSEENGNVILDKNDWKLILINKQHPVPADYEVELGIIKDNMKCDKRIVGDLHNMLQAAKKDGINLLICSPYRDYNRQEILFERKINAYMGKGLSYMEAYKVSSSAVTVPGASEHQIGMALDIVCDTYMSLNEGFGDTKAGKWLYENAHNYGFIQRYPKGKEHITGIMYEPWHYRYVGTDAATMIKESDITLEELVEGL